MKYSLHEIFSKIAERIDVIYLIDEAEDTYEMVKDNDFFHSIFGDNGSYSEMLSVFLESTSDKIIAESPLYSRFLKGANRFTGIFSNHAKIHMRGEEVTVSLAKYPIDDTASVILISEINKEEYNQCIHKDEKLNAIKSAYLFSMNVDLVEDKCCSINMSEVENGPVSERAIKYSEWRKMIVDMFPPKDQELFKRISDPESLRKNLNYNYSRSVDCQMMNLEGKYIWVKLIFHRINTGNDNDFKFLYMVEDIDESHAILMENLSKYEECANKDALTGLMNRSKIEAEVKTSIGKCQSEKEPISLILFDIDNFKQVNDKYGHATGDKVLRSLSSLVREYMEMQGIKVGRWGGEEFLCACENTVLDEVIKIVENIKEKISSHQFDKVGNITCSFGITEVKADDTYDDAFDRVDTALYQAKNGGRNKVIIL